MTDLVVQEFKTWIGNENISYFKHLKGLTGTYSPVLKLNVVKKGIPVHPVHLREGMQIRNWMRGREEFNTYSSEDFDNKWVELIEKACNLK